MADPNAPRTARALAREVLTRQILRTAREHLTRVGPGELSLRAVSRDLGMASSAVYRFQPPLTSAQRAAIEPVATGWGPALPGELVARGLTAWCTVMGVVSMELFGHLTAGVVDGTAYFDYVVAQLAADLGLGSGVPPVSPTGVTDVVVALP